MSVWIPNEHPFISMVRPVSGRSGAGGYVFERPHGNGIALRCAHYGSHDLIAVPLATKARRRRAH